MNFSLDSEELFKMFIPDFDKFLIKKTPLKQKKLDNILKILYNEIKIGRAVGQCRKYIKQNTNTFKGEE